MYYSFVLGKVPGSHRRKITFREGCGAKAAYATTKTFPVFLSYSPERRADSEHLTVVSSRYS